MTDKLDNTKGTLANYFDRFIIAKHGNFTIFFVLFERKLRLELT